MQGDVEHIAQALGSLGIAVAGEQRGEDVPMPGECREKRVILSDPAGAVQKDQRPALAGLEHMYLASAAGHSEKIGATARLAASVAIAAGAARRASGWIQKRSSLS